MLVTLIFLLPLKFLPSISGLKRLLKHQESLHSILFSPPFEHLSLGLGGLRRDGGPGTQP